MASSVNFSLSPSKVCANSLCGRSDISLKMCAACEAVFYCGRECQRADWRAGHKLQCKEVQRLKSSPIPPALSVFQGVFSPPSDPLRHTPFFILNEDISSSIVSFLDPTELARMKGVSTRAKALIESEKLIYSNGFSKDLFVWWVLSKRYIRDLLDLLVKHQVDSPKVMAKLRAFLANQDGVVLTETEDGIKALKYMVTNLAFEGMCQCLGLEVDDSEFCKTHQMMIALNDPFMSQGYFFREFLKRRVLELAAAGNFEKALQFAKQESCFSSKNQLLESILEPLLGDSLLSLPESLFSKRVEVAIKAAQQLSLPYSLEQDLARDQVFAKVQAAFEKRGGLQNLYRAKEMISLFASPSRGRLAYFLDRRIEAISPWVDAIEKFLKSRLYGAAVQVAKRLKEVDSGSADEMLIHIGRTIASSEYFEEEGENFSNIKEAFSLLTNDYSRKEFLQDIDYYLLKGESAFKKRLEELVEEFIPKQGLKETLLDSLEYIDDIANKKKAD